MNYQAHYDRLIARAKARALSGYIETHHVVPKCMGGPDSADNLVRLTPEEHFVAHQLLRKIYPHSKSLVYALIVMVADRYGYRSNKLYGWIRKRHSINVSAQSKAMWQDPEYRAKHKAAMDEVRSRPGYREQFSRIHKGRVKSAKERANISKGKTGLKYKPMSDESRARMSAARRKTWAERRAKGEHLLIAQKVKEARIRNGSYGRKNKAGLPPL